MNFTIKLLNNSCKNISLFNNVIYNNFIELSEYPILKHTLEDINILLLSKNMRGFLIYNDDNKVIGYLFGEIIKLNDGRNVFFLSYIYVAIAYRKLKIGSLMLNKVIQNTKKTDGILLICDSEDTFVMNFYQMKGFMPDLILRRYDKYDLMYLPHS